MINVAILGLGKVGQTLLQSLETTPELKSLFVVRGLWNRSPSVFTDMDLPSGIVVYPDVETLLDNLSDIDLVIECSHPSVLIQYAGRILERSNLFVSSPTAFANPDFLDSIQQQLKHCQHQCYIGLGASLGVQDIIRLDRGRQIKSLEVEMRKHPDSFKLPGETEQAEQQIAREQDGDTVLASGTVGEVNAVAPQNTNTMSAFALAASNLGFSGCTARIVANPALDSHIVLCKVETEGGLRLTLLRDNPAGHGQVTGSATFYSFLESVTNHASGIRHNGFVFC